MSDLNLAVFTGRLCWDAEVQYTKNGKKFTRLCVAVGNLHKDETGNFVEGVDFLTANLFLRDNDRRLEYLKKGQAVVVRGRLRQVRYEADGKKKSYLSIAVNSLNFIFDRKLNDEEDSQMRSEDMADDAVMESEFVYEVSENSADDIY